MKLKQVKQLAKILYKRSMKYYDKGNTGNLNAKHTLAQYEDCIFILMQLATESINSHSIEVWMTILLGEEAEEVLKDYVEKVNI